MHRRPIVCRQIEERDFEAAIALLSKGFPERRPDYWLRGLHHLRDRDDCPAGRPRFGYFIEAEGRPVGLWLALYSFIGGAGGDYVRCNISSWYIEAPFRGYTIVMAKKTFRDRDVTFTDISPAPHTLQIVQRYGFRSSSRGNFICLPALARDRGRTDIEVISAATTRVDGLGEADVAMLTSHARLGCLSLVCHLPDRALPFILMPRLMRSGRLQTPAMQLVYTPGIPAFVRCAPAIGRLLIRRLRPLVLIDADGPIDGLVGRFVSGVGHRLFYGPRRPDLADLRYSEMVVFGF